VPTPQSVSTTCACELVFPKHFSRVFSCISPCHFGNARSQTFVHAGRPCWWTRRPEAVVPIRSSAPLRSPQIKKIMHHRDSAPPGSCTPLVGLPLHHRHARTAVACSPATAPPQCARCARSHHPTADVVAMHAPYRWGLRSRPPAAILLLHRDRTSRIPLCLLCYLTAMFC
jgi:hypothetical protein